MKKGNHCLEKACFVSPVSSGQGLHILGGENCELGADCPTCKVPLVQFIQLNISDPLICFPDVGLKHLSLLHCPRCAAFLQDMSYRVMAEGRIDLVDIALGKEEWLQEEWLKVFPSGSASPMECVLKPLPAAVQAVFDKANNELELSKDDEALVASYTGHYANPEVGSYPVFGEINQVGGRPYLPQGFLKPPCPCCKSAGKHREMTFVACLTNDRWHNLKLISPDCYLTFFMCLHCLTITASQYAT